MINKKRTTIAGLVVSASLLVSVAVNEGYRGEAYTPVKGDVPTIGFGETQGVKLGQKTDPVRSLIVLENDLDQRKAALAKLIHVPLYQYELDSYMDFAYNVGLENFRTSTLLKLLNQEKYQEACKELLKWDKFHGKVLNGLKFRREQEYKTCIGDNK